MSERLDAASAAHGSLRFSGTFKPTRYCAWHIGNLVFTRASVESGCRRRPLFRLTDGPEHEARSPCDRQNLCVEVLSSSREAGRTHQPLPHARQPFAIDR